MPRSKRVRIPRPTTCPWCGQDMSIPSDYIDWEVVWFEKICNEKKQEVGRDLTDAEMDEIKSGIIGDPCDDCCCGGCGSRKDYPGQCHC